MPELPLPGYHQLSVGDLRHRVRSLDRPQLAILLAEEREHGARPDTGAEPSTPLRHGQADQTPNRSG